VVCDGSVVVKRVFARHFKSRRFRCDVLSRNDIFVASFSLQHEFELGQLYQQFVNKVGMQEIAGMASLGCQCWHGTTKKSQSTKCRRMSVRSRCLSFLLSRAKQ
jgi:hypothetical protein